MNNNELQSYLRHKETKVFEMDTFWKTQARGTNDQEYQIYLSCANDGKGIDFTTGNKLKTYDEWVSS